MKTFIVKIFFVLSLVIITSACTGDFEEVNTDPNQPTSVPAVNLFTQAQFNLADIMWGRAMNFEFAMLMVQHFSQNEYAEDSRYNQVAANFNVPWQNFYAGGLIDLHEAKILTEADASLSAEVKNNRLAQIAVMRVWAIQMMTDIWGDVPYTQALNPEEFPNPAYDDQADIYVGLVAELNAAIAQISTSNEGFTGGDIVYGGDMAAWAKFANSLKLRVGMRMADANASLAATVVSEAFASPLGVFTSSADNALFVFDSDQRLANPFFVDAITRDDFAISAFLVEQMNSRNDDRLAQFAEPNANGDIVGIPYGLTDPESFQLKANSSRPHNSIKEATAPAIMMSYVEVEFFRAEAIQRGFVAGNASEAFNNAVRASFAQWGRSTAEADAYLVANPYNAASWEASIGYEKWVALYTQGIEAWAEHRRLNFPALAVPAAAVRSSIPVRALYPSVEAEANGANLEATGIGVTDMSTRVWWDQN